MKPAVSLWILVAGVVVGAQQVWSPRETYDIITHPGGKRNDENVTRYLPPACATACYDRVLTGTSCQAADFSANSNCCSSDIHANLMSCVQSGCPTLKDVLLWQTYYTGECGIDPREEIVLQIVVSYVLFGLATLFVIGRFLSRSRYMAGPGFWWDDWAALILWVFSIEMAICLPFMQDHGAGEDVWGGATINDIHQMLMWVYICEAFYLIGTFGSKMVLILLYLRTWEANTGFRKICWASLVALFIGMLSFTASGLAVLWPLHYYIGDSARVQQQRWGIDHVAAVTSVAAINVAADFLVLLLPVSKLMTLRSLSFQKRAGISAIFLLGFVVTACSIVRITYIIPLRNSTNATWDFGKFGLWSEIEVHLSLVCCNVPATAGLIHRMRLRRKKGMAFSGKSTENTQSTTFANMDSTMGGGEFTVIDPQDRDQTPTEADYRPASADDNTVSLRQCNSAP